MSIELFEKKESQLELYAKLAEAEAEIANGAEPMNFRHCASKLKKKLEESIGKNELETH